MGMVGETKEQVWGYFGMSNNKNEKCIEFNFLDNMWITDVLFPLVG
jgi:hypothetical protein